MDKQINKAHHPPRKVNSLVLALLLYLLHNLSFTLLCCGWFCFCLFVCLIKLSCLNGTIVSTIQNNNQAQSLTSPSSVCQTSQPPIAMTSNQSNQNTIFTVVHLNQKKIPKSKIKSIISTSISTSISKQRHIS